MDVTAPPSCDQSAYLNNTCIHDDQGQLANFSAHSAADCCGACAGNVSCGAWSFKSVETSGNHVCVLKTLTGHQNGKPGKCISGISRPIGP